LIGSERAGRDEKVFRNPAREPTPQLPLSKKGSFMTSNNKSVSPLSGQPPTEPEAEYSKNDPAESETAWSRGKLGDDGSLHVESAAETLRRLGWTMPDEPLEVACGPPDTRTPDQLRYYNELTPELRDIAYREQFYALKYRLEELVAVNRERIAEAIGGAISDSRVGDRARVVDGAAFLLDEDDALPALWGPSGAMLWARGESLMLYGPPGRLKSTLAQWLTLARLGLVPDVLGYPVTDDGGRVLYLAMDRPAQVRRGMRRMVNPDMAPVLAKRLEVRKGPLAVNVATEKHTRYLADLCRSEGFTTVVVDSVKDVAPRLSDDEVASYYNLARQEALAAGIEWIELHHDRKANKDGRAAATLDDVYGSRHLTAGAGSVIGLFGDLEADGHVTMRQHKALEDYHPRLTVTVDSATGALSATPAESWAKIVTACREAGEKLSQRKLADATGLSKTTVQRAIANHQDDWDRGWFLELR
jgi:hypothetical protein